MRTALISDIHGHYDGLIKVLEDIELQACHRILCLGDLVEGGAEDELVVRTIRERQIPCVQGNHDADHALTLAPEILEYLNQIPTRREEDDILYCHISPREKRLKINKKFEAWNVFDETPHRLIFTGHQHLPLIYGYKAESFGEATLHDFVHNEPFGLDPLDRYIICVGSASYGRDQVGLLRYAIYDSEQDTVEHRTVEGPLLPRDYTLR